MFHLSFSGQEMIAEWKYGLLVLEIIRDWNREGRIGGTKSSVGVT